MRKRAFLVGLLAAVCLLTACDMRTVDEMYCLPKRPEAYDNLQSAIDEAMDGKEYSSPLSGENLQTVQMVDLDGDGEREYLLFAKSESDKPLQMLIFRREGEKYTLFHRPPHWFDVVLHRKLYEWRHWRNGRGTPPCRPNRQVAK